MEIKHALIAASREGGKILHLIAYDDPPDFSDYVRMVDELKSDAQFDMTELKYGDDYIIIQANGPTLKMINEELAKRPEEFEIKIHDGKHNEQPA